MENNNKIYRNAAVFLTAIVITGIMVFLVDDFSSFIVYTRALTAVMLITWIVASLLAEREEKNFIIHLTFLAVFIRIAFALLLFVLSPEGTYLMGNAGKFDGLAWSHANAGSFYFISYRFPTFIYFLSFIYRIFAQDAHLPFLPIIFIAMLGGFISPFTYQFASIAFNNKRIAKIAGTVVALHPEIIFHASLQIRDQIIALGVAMSLFGIIKMKQKISIGFIINIIGIIAVFFLNPSFGFPIVLVCCSILLFLYRRSGFVVIATMLMVLAFSLLAGSNLLKSRSMTPRSYITGELFIDKVSGGYKAEPKKEYDALSRNIIKKFPVIARESVLMVWGTFQPWIAQGAYALTNPRKIYAGLSFAIRSFGWNLTMPFLLCGIFLGIKNRKDSMLLLLLSLAAVGSILIPLFQNWADQWDYPRYRSVGAVFYGCVISAGWVYGSSLKGRVLQKLMAGVVFLNVILLGAYVFRKGIINSLLSSIITVRLLELPGSVSDLIVSDGIPIMTGIYYVLINLFILKKLSKYKQLPDNVKIG